MFMTNRSNFSLPPLDIQSEKSLSIFSPPHHVSLFSTTNQKLLHKKLTLLERLQSSSEESVDEQEQQSQENEQQTIRTILTANAKNKVADEEDEDDNLFTRLAKQTAAGESTVHQPAPSGGHFPASIPSYAYALATNRSKKRPFFDHRSQSNAPPQFHSHARHPHTYTHAAGAVSSGSDGIMAVPWLNWPRFHSAEIESQEPLLHQHHHDATIVLTHPASQPMVVRYLPSLHAKQSQATVADDLDSVASPSPPQDNSQLASTHKGSDNDIPEKTVEDLSRRVSVNSSGVHERLLAMAMKIHEQNLCGSNSSNVVVSSNPTSHSSPATQLLTRPLTLPVNIHLSEFQSNPAFRSTDRSQLRTIRADREDNDATAEHPVILSTSPALSPSPGSVSSENSLQLPRDVDSALSPNPQSALSAVNLAQATANLPFELLRSGVHVYVPWKREERQSKRMSDADPHAFYSFSLSGKAPFLFLLRNIHSKRVKLSILLSRIHFICLTNDDRASIFISYHGRTTRSNKKSQQESQVKPGNSATSNSSLSSASNKRHLYLWPIDQRDCLSWFHLILRAWRTLKDVSSYSTIPKLNVIDMLKKLLNQNNEGNLINEQYPASSVAVNEEAADDDELEAASGSEHGECYFCRSSSSTNSDNHQQLEPFSQEETPTVRITPQATNSFTHTQQTEQTPQQQVSAAMMHVDIPPNHSIVCVAVSPSPAIPAPPPPTLKANVSAENGVQSNALNAQSPVVFHSEGSSVQGQQMAQPLQIELHCIEEEQQDKAGVCARSSRCAAAAAARILRHRRDTSYSAQPFNSPPAPISNPLSSPHYRPIQRSKSNLLPAEEIRQQLLECRYRFQRLEFLAARWKKDESVLIQRYGGKLASLVCHRKILREQNLLLRKIANQRMFERLSQASIYV